MLNYSVAELRINLNFQQKEKDVESVPRLTIRDDHQHSSCLRPHKLLAQTIILCYNEARKFKQLQ